MAEAEATTALLNATAALRKPDDLDWIKRHAAYVVHAIDPSLQESGPGRGYGVVKAAQGIIDYITAAGKSPDASEKVRSYARRVAVSARNVLTRAKRVADLAEKVQRMRTKRNAVRVMRQIRRICQQILLGRDANKDGKVTWKRYEGGLAQARHYMQLMNRYEGLP